MVDLLILAFMMSTKTLSFINNIFPSARKTKKGRTSDKSQAFRSIAIMEDPTELQMGHLNYNCSI